MLTRKVNLDNDTHDNHPFIICRDFSSIQFEQLRGGQKKGTPDTILGQISGPELAGPAASTTALILFCCVKMSIGKVELTCIHSQCVKKEIPIKCYN